jgi:hypothetical protein
MKTQDGVQGLVRVSVNLSPAALDYLRSYADKNGITVTEAVRHAIGVLKFLDEGKANGARFYREEDKRLREVEFAFIL